MTDAVIYADHAATTPCDPAVVDCVARILAGGPTNASGRQHRFGRRALGHLDAARQQVADLIGADDPRQIMFTSGATEACNLAIIGCMQRLMSERPRLVIGATEHPAVTATAAACGRAGADVVTISVDSQGHFDETVLAGLINRRAGLVCCMLANNETGVIHPIGDIATYAHQCGVLLLVDATQALGILPVDVAELGADIIVGSGHKIYGPQGTGFLWLRRGLAIEPLIHGGGQERGLRSGTEPVAALAGLGLAAEIAAGRRMDDHMHLRSLTAQLEDGLGQQIPDLVIHGGEVPRRPGISFFGVPGLSRGLLAQLGPVAASGGSSCASAKGKASAVLQAMGVSEADAANAIRISLGRASTAADVERIIAQVVRGVDRLR